jgi:transposase-like protein
MFKGRHFDRSVILLCVRWYLAYNLSLRNLEEMMAERGISVDHATIHRWVVRYSPELPERFNRSKRPVSRKWHIDETYIKVRGRWMYLYRAIDSNGDTVEFWFSERRDLTVAKRFLRKALKRHGRPERIVIDGSQTNRKPSCPATQQIGCRTNPDGSSSRSGSGRAATSTTVSNRTTVRSSGEFDPCLVSSLSPLPALSSAGSKWFA